MILECPACHARFKANAAQFPEAGRMVRCGKCAHEWLATMPIEPVVSPVPIEMPLAAEEPVTVVVPTELTADAAAEDVLRRLDAMIAEPKIATRRPASSAPARRKRNPKPFMIAAPLLAGAWLVLALIAYFPQWSQVPALAGVYQALGAKPLDGVVFADVAMERQQEGSKAKFILSGSIRNHSSETRDAPTVRVLLKDKNNKTLWGREYPVKAQLKAGDVYPFRITNVETNFASSVSAIVVDMGNSLQLMVR